MDKIPNQDFVNNASGDESVRSPLYPDYQPYISNIIHDNPKVGDVVYYPHIGAKHGKHYIGTTSGWHKVSGFLLLRALNIWKMIDIFLLDLDIPTKTP